MGLSQIPHMAGVKHVEAAAGENKALAGGVQGIAESGGVG